MRFFAKIALYALPFVVPFVLVTGGLVYVGESMPLDVVIRMQDSTTPVLFRPRYGDLDQRYKQMAVDYFQPEVLVTGSSRVLQFRAQFLTHNPDEFYNAAAPAWQLEEVGRLLHTMNHRPRIIILGIDDPWFNADYGGDPIVEPPVTDYARIFIVNRTFIQEVLHGEPFDIERYLARVEPGGSGGFALGLRAIRDGHGFRNDGSEQYGDFLVAQHLWPPNTRGQHTGWFEDGEQMYVRGSEIDAAAMTQMRDILAFAKRHNILLIGVMPPYMPSLWEQMADSPRHTYLQALTPQLEALFAEYDLPLFDYRDGAKLGASDEDFFDGWHPSERIAAQLFISIAREVPELQPYSDLDALQEIVNTAPDTFRVFPFVAQE